MAAGGGRSVAEHSPREFIGERVPALYPLILVLQAVKPVLQALALGVDAQNHTTYRRGVKGAARGRGAGPPTGPSPGRPPPLPRFHALRPDPPPYPPGSEGGQCSDRHPTLLVPQIRAWGSCSSSTRDQSSTGAECSGVLGDKGWRQKRARKGQGSSTVHSPQVYQGFWPQGLGVQPEALTITTSHACSTDCWVTLQASFPL